jgi:hypothetical protein
LKIDTGLHRVGCAPESAAAAAAFLAGDPCLPCDAIRALVHVANSGAAVLHENACFDILRVGICLDGDPVIVQTGWPDDAAMAAAKAMRPIMRLWRKSRSSKRSGGKPGAVSADRIRRLDEEGGRRIDVCLRGSVGRRWMDQRCLRKGEEVIEASASGCRIGCENEIQQPMSEAVSTIEMLKGEIAASIRRSQTCVMRRSRSAQAEKRSQVLAEQLAYSEEKKRLMKLEISQLDRSI